MIKRNQGLPLVLTCIHFDHKNVEKNVALVVFAPYMKPKPGRFGRFFLG